MGRKPTRAEGSQLRFERRKQISRTPRARLDVTWDRVLAALVALAKADPRTADDTCRDLADQLEQIVGDITKTTARIQES